MPLSEHEQKILAELEESLVRQDPDFAERVRSETVYRHAGRYCKWSAFTFLVGTAILIGFYSMSVILGFLGVAIMFASLVVFERNMRRMGKAGWHDLTHHNHEEQVGAKTPAGGVENAMNDAREWFRSRFRRES